MAGMTTLNVAVLDDYQGVALQLADWGPVQARARVDVFTDPLADEAAVVERLSSYDVLCVMRERTPLRAATLARLPRLKAIVSTGARNASIDTEAAKQRGIEIFNTGYFSTPTAELTWALILASARHIPQENAALRGGGWQQTLGEDLDGKTLGIIGLGRVGSLVAKVGLAFGMKVLAWSQNLTAEKAAEAGATRVEKADLLRHSDVISVHLILSERTRGIIGAAEFALMKPTACLVNTSRGPLVVEQALLDALRTRRIARAAIDVYDTEPLPAEHPLRRADNLLATPHVGYVSRGLYEIFYRDTVAHLLRWLDARGAAAPPSPR
jgi:phosphoglycerate dehydrogenase-like enzyme